MTNPWDIAVITEDELLELFGPHRPDAAAFRAAVEARIAIREGGSDGGARQISADGVTNEPSASTAPGGDETVGREPGAASLQSDDGGDSGRRVDTRVAELRHPAFWRRVAALLPFDPLTGGAATGLAAAKTFGGKVVPAAFALPALVVLALVGSAVGAARSVQRATKPELGESWHAGDPIVGRPRGKRALLYTLALGLLAALGMVLLVFAPTRHAADGMLLVFLTVVLGQQREVRRLAREGAFVRREVARMVLGTGVLSFVVFQFRERFGHCPDVALFITSCALLYTLRAGLVLSRGRPPGLVPTAGVLAAAALFNVFGLSWSGPTSARWLVARADLDPASTRDWDGAAALQRALVAIGEATPPLDDVHAALARALADRTVVEDAVWSAAYDLGHFADAAAWATLARKERRQRREVFEAHEVTRWHLDLDERYTTPWLLAFEVPPSDFLEWLAQSTLASWPRPDESFRLEKALAVTLKLEALGRAGLLATLRAPAHALLRAQWVEPKWGWSSDGGRFAHDDPESGYRAVESTLFAVELMARFGVPDGIDLFDVEAFLRTEARSSAIPIPLFMDDEGRHARAALLRLRHELGLPARGVSGVLLEYRLLFGALLIASLALVSLRLAPPLRAGAQP